MTENSTVRGANGDQLPTDVESEPEIALRLFGDSIDQARLFAADLAEKGELLGLIGPSEYPRLWTRHIVNSVLLASLVTESVADVGSGAGLPGIPLAIARPDVEFTLIEPMERRTAWLTEEVERLGLTNVRVLRGRAEDVRDDVAVRQVTARAVSALSKLIPLTAPLVVAGGELLLLKGRGAEAELAKAAKVIRKHRLSNVRVEELGAELGTEVTRVVRADVDADDAARN
ncbi:MAG: 16S rRNA (guanine(527)-N(7))-methyltransferase RsmG [Pseudoclavibacter sp.]